MFEMVKQSAVVTTEINFNDSLIQSWIVFVHAGSEQTIKAYNVAIKRFYRYLQDNGISEPTRADIQNYRDEMEKTLRPASVKLNLNAVKMFFAWLSSEGLYSNIGLNIKMSTEKRGEMATHKRAALTAKEAAKVLKLMPRDNSEKSLRNLCIMNLMICCGLRSIEVCRLNKGNIKTRGGKYYLEVQGKGYKTADAKVVLPKQLFIMIQAYLQTRKNVYADSPLFTSTSRRCKNARLESQTVSRLAKAALKAAGFDGDEYTCHSCRHTCASIALDENVSLRDIQRNLRHASVKTTEIYVHDRDELNNPTTCRVTDTIFKEMMINVA